MLFGYRVREPARIYEGDAPLCRAGRAGAVDRPFLGFGGLVFRLRAEHSGKWVNFSETPRYFNGASIVLNLHRSEDDPLLDKNRSGAPGHSINNRTFDIAACRAFQLTDYRPDLPLFYRPEEEIVCFDSPKECAELIHRYLHDRPARNEIADRAYRRTLAGHTFADRLDAMLSLIRSP